MEYINPILPKGADPWVIYHNNYYYYCHIVDEKSIHIARSETMIGLSKAITAPVWTPPDTGEYAKEVWAPELHFYKGIPYIYFAASDGNVNNHRMFMLEGKTSNPLGEYTFKGMVTPSDVYAIDGTILKYDGEMYMIWSGIDFKNHPNEQRLYIARMKNPYQLDTPGVCISSPTYDWEKIGPQPVNEGPTVLKSFNKVFIVYSASHSLTDHYCLGMLTLVGKDALNPKSWRKNPEAVFCSTQDVFAPGHASFTVSPDGEENWIIYHAAVRSGAGWERDVRAQRFTWNEDGIPNFGSPVSPKLRQAVPSGETSLIDKYFINNMQE
jgi:GH43 family beta-xylosidase